MEIRESGERAVAERERTSLAKSVEAVLRAREHGTRASFAGWQAVGVRVDEVRVQERRPRAAHDSEQPREGQRVGVDACSRMPSTGTPASTRRPANSHAPGSSSCRRAEARVPAALAEVREQRQQMRLRAGDTRDLADVEDRVVTVTPRAPRCGRPTTRRSARARPAPRSSPPDRGEIELDAARGCGAASAAASSRGKRSSSRRKPAKTGFDASTGQARRGGLVDDLVGRAGAHVVDERVRPRPSAPGHARAGPARRVITRSPTPSSATSDSSSARWRRSSSVSDGPCSDQRRLRHLGDGADHRVEPLRRRRPAEREQRGSPSPRLRSAHGKSARSMPCPIGTSLRDGERERAAVDRDDRRRERAPRAGAAGSRASA